MNLTKLFEAQRELDARIRHDKGLEGVDLLPRKILALQVELGELANEWRGFKFWSNDREPRGEMKIQCPECHGEGVKPALGPSLGVTEIDCMDCDENAEVTINPLLEEYVDCLHFILSIGLEIKSDYVDKYSQPFPSEGERSTETIIARFVDLMRLTGELMYDDFYANILLYFFDLGYSLGFTWEQIEDAYFSKNAVNHARQGSGY